ATRRTDHPDAVAGGQVEAEDVRPVGAGSRAGRVRRGRGLPGDIGPHTVAPYLHLRSRREPAAVAEHRPGRVDDLVQVVRPRPGVSPPAERFALVVPVVLVLRADAVVVARLPE